MFELTGYSEYSEDKKFAMLRCECDRTSIAFIPYSDLEVHSEKYCVLKDGVELVCSECGRKQIEKYIPLEQQTFSHINIPTCPTCGSTSVQKLSATSKVIGVGLLGLASKTVGKTYKCNNCNYYW